MIGRLYLPMLILGRVIFPTTPDPRDLCLAQSKASWLAEPLNAEAMALKLWGLWSWMMKTMRKLSSWEVVLSKTIGGGDNLPKLTIFDSLLQGGPLPVSEVV